MPSPRKITLRHVTENDLPLLCQLAASAEMRGEFESGLLRSPQAMRKRFAEDGFSSDAAERLLVCDESGAVIGSVSHFLAHRYATARELGWSIHEPALRGRGYGSAAVQALVDYLFLNLPINRLACSMAPGNIASRRVAEKAGFKYEGFLRGVVFMQGAYQDGELLGMVRGDWEARRREIDAVPGGVLP